MPMTMGSMNRITRCLSVYRTRRFGAELNGYHHSLVLTICRRPGSTQEEIAEHVCLNKSTVARALTQLEERGYITRSPNPSDKRQLLVEPTEKLRAVFPAVRAITHEWNSRISEGISEEELEIFASVLRRMEQNARRVLQETEETTP